VKVEREVNAKTYLRCKNGFFSGHFVKKEKRGKRKINFHDYEL
jgi:hypothetical protein